MWRVEGTGSGLKRNDEVEVVVVPLPTIGRHVRERGLDHTAILAKEVGETKGWKYEKTLGRATDVVQVGTKATERKSRRRILMRWCGSEWREIIFVGG